MKNNQAIAKREAAQQLATPEMSDFMNMIQAAAANPDVDVAKLEALLNMQERIIDKSAKAEWTQAMSDAQEEMRRVRSNRQNPLTKSKYPDYAALDRVLRPIYTRHGFSLTFDTGQGEDPTPVPPDYVRVWIAVAHRAGHVDRKHVDIPADGKGARGGDVMTKTHATGSAMSYGMRYLLKFAFNVAVGEDDDDGNSAGAFEDPDGVRPDAERAPSPNRAPQSKSAGREKAQESAKVTNPLGLKRAATVDDKITPSNLKTLASQMKHLKIPDDKFRRVFGFPLEDADRHDLNAILGWIKEESR